jgi:hypothetical protein
MLTRQLSEFPAAGAVSGRDDARPERVLSPGNLADSTSRLIRQEGFPAKMPSPGHISTKAT